MLILTVTLLGTPADLTSFRVSTIGWSPPKTSRRNLVGYFPERKPPASAKNFDHRLVKRPHQEECRRERCQAGREAPGRTTGTPLYQIEMHATPRPTIVSCVPTFEQALGCVHHRTELPPA